MKRKQRHFHFRKTKRTMAGILSLVMMLGVMPLRTLAANYNVANATELVNSWIAASGNSDTSNTFNMNADINMSGQTLEVKAGKDYTINGKGNTLYNVVIEENDNVSKESQQADVTIKADVENTGNSSALQVSGDVNVTVTKDVEGSGYSPALNAQDGAEVVVKENVEATGGGSAVVAGSDAKVTVNGDVESKSGPTIIADNATVKVDGDVTLDNTKDYDPDAVSESNSANVIIGGDLISGGDAALLSGGSTLTVDGNIKAGASAMNVRNSTVTVNGDITSDGQSVISRNSDVTVNGDFLVQHNFGEVTMDGGLYVTSGSSLDMADSTMLESDQMHVAGNSSLNAALVDTAQVTVGIIEGNANDTSTFHAYSNTVSTSLTNLDAAGKTYTQIIGHVDSITARQNATVEVAGSVGKVTRKDKAKVTTDMADKDKVQTYLPTPEGENYSVGNTTAHAIINLCNGYAVNSTLYRQHSEMLGLLANVSGDISNKLNLGSAAWTALFDHESINLSTYMSSRYTGHEFYNNTNYNQESRDNFNSAANLNTYLIDMYKDNLANSLVDLSNSEREWNQTAADECELILKIFAFTKKIEDASGVKLSEAEKKYLSNLTGSDGKISGTEMLDFLRKFGHYTENDPGAVLAAQRLSRMYEKIGPYMEDAKFLAKLGKAGVTIADYVKYNVADYTNQIVALDQILATQPLSAEMFAAAAELRTTMENKLLGNVEKTVNLVKKESVGVIKDMYGPLAAVQAVVDITGLITGGTKDAEDLQNGAALTILAPQLLTVFENSIEAVRNGDTSEEAVRMVYMSYTMVCTTLEDMCDIMTNIGNKSQENTYKDILEKLKTMKLGTVVDIG